MGMWSTNEEKQLEALRLSPHRSSPEKLRLLIRHFMDNGSLWAVTEGDGPLSVSKDLARKVKDLTRSGDLAWVLDRSVLPSTSQGQSGANELGPHLRELHYLGVRLRDRLTLPNPDRIVGMDARRSSDDLGLWMGPAIDESFRDPEEEAIEMRWGFEDYDARSHPVFDDFRQHLAEARFLELLDRLGETFRAYRSACGQTHEHIQSEIGALLPDLTSYDVIVMSLSLLANIYRPSTGDDWIEFDYTPVETQRGWAVQLGSWRVGSEAECRQLAEIIAAHRNLVDQSVSWEICQHLESARRAALQSIDEFRASLEPNSRLRRQIVRGKCDGCV